MTVTKPYFGDLHFGVYLLPKEKNRWRYSISPSFQDAQHFAADLHARTDRQSQVTVGIFTNVNVDLYRKACSVVGDLNSRVDSHLPVFDEHTLITIDDIIKHTPKVQS